MNIVRIKSTHKESQGDFVEVNEEDFDKTTMELYVEPKAEVKAVKPKTKTRAK